eukprot:4618193-Prymnesium_polylepis.1
MPVSCAVERANKDMDSVVAGWFVLVHWSVAPSVCFRVTLTLRLYYRDALCRHAVPAVSLTHLELPKTKRYCLLTGSLRE